jgi:photosystem II stability/assembly factor-like uncharacterized protein
VPIPPLDPTLLQHQQLERADDLTFLDASHGWLLAEACLDGSVGRLPCELAVRATSDGGQSWQDTEAPTPVSVDGEPTHDNRAARIIFATTTDGWLYGPGLDVTHDGGSTWQEEQIDGDVTTLVAARGLAWMVVDHCTALRMCGLRVLLSRDGGRSWQPPAANPALTGDWATALAAADGSVSIFAGTAVRTNDGGKTWQTLLNPCFAGSPPEDGYVVHVDGSGSTLWAGCSSDPGFYSFIASGQPMHWPPLRSTDGGLSWALVQTAFTPVSLVIAMAAPSASTVFVTDGSVPQRSNDGGATWTSAIPQGNSRLCCCIRFTDTLTGWLAAGFNSEVAVWRTEDGGNTWQRVVVR